MNVFKRGIFSFKNTLTQLREELDEHLTSINENTGEIQTNYAYMQELENKIEHISTRLDRIEMLIEGRSSRPYVQSLTFSEKQVFLVLYTEEVPLTYANIAQRTSYPEALVKQYVVGLIEKGIPVIKSYFNTTAFMKLNPAFKELQAKENILNLSLKAFVED